MQRDELAHRDQICDRKCAVTPALARAEQPNQSAKPQRKCGWIHNQDLLQGKFYRAERDILVAVRDVAKQFIGGPVVPRLPEHIRQCYGECGKAAEPNPFPGKVAALRCQQQPR